MRPSATEAPHAVAQSPASSQVNTHMERAPEATEAKAGTTPMLRRRPILIGGIATVVLVIVVLTSGRSTPNEVQVALPAPDPLAATAAALTQDISRFNTSSEAAYFRTMIANRQSIEGPGRCWAGFSADFPDQSLLTLIWPTGFWLQVSPGAQGSALTSSMRLGADYTRAGISSADLDMKAVGCTTLPDGTIQLNA